MKNSPLDEYEQWLRTWASERTVEARMTMLKGRMRDWGGVSGFTYDNVSAFLGRTRTAAGKPITKWTKNTYYGHLKCICSWLHTAGYLAENPMESIKNGKRPNSKPRPLSEPEVERVLAAVDGQVRDWIMLALNAGLRVSEIAAIRGEDVSPDTIYVRGKGDVAAALPCHPDLWEMAQRYPRRGYWFPGGEDGHIRSQHISLTVGRIFFGLGIAGSIHRCRHSYGTRLLRSGVHIRTVQKLMRHANLETTANYTAVDEDEMRDAILRLPPVA